MAPTSTISHPTTSAGQSGQASSALPVEFVESDSTPGTYYKTTPATCSCPDYTYRSFTDGQHRCKHQVGQAWMAPFQCVRCFDWTCWTAESHCEGCTGLIMAEAERVKWEIIDRIVGEQSIPTVAPASKQVMRSHAYRQALEEVLYPRCKHGVTIHAYCEGCQSEHDAALSAAARTERIAGYRAELASGKDLWA